MAMTVDRALGQRRDALARANEVRLANAQIKKDLRAGRLTFGEALAAPTIGSAQVWDVLVAVPGLGKMKAQRLLRTEGIGPFRRVRMLSPRERAVLVDEVEGLRR